MLVKKLLLASISVMFINTSVYGEEWGRVRCLKECTNVSCADAAKKEICQTNCAQNLDSIDACIKAKPQGSSQGTKPSLPPRRALPQQPQPQPSPVQSEPTAEHSTDSASPQLKKQPSAHHVTGAGGKGVTSEEKMAEQVKALNEGKGVKVKHMKEKLEGLEKLVEALQNRISMLEPLAGNVFGVQETLQKLQVNTGFNKPEVRNNPEHDIDYKPEQFSAVSSASGTVDGTSCQAVVTKVQQKAKETKDKVKSKKLSIFETQLAEMCKMTKDLNRTPGKKVRDAEAVNRIFGEAKKLF
jgi:hypothetical protein